MKKHWTEDEIKTLKKNLHLSYQELSEILKRAIPSIKHKCWELGLTRQNKKWTDSEVEFLKNNLHLKRKKLAEILQTKETVVNTKIINLKLTKKQIWSDSETQELIKLTHLGFNYEQIAESLGKTTLQIINKTRNLIKTNKLPKTRIVKTWTVSEINKVKELIKQDFTINAIAKELNRTYSSIQYAINSFKT